MNHLPSHYPTVFSLFNCLTRSQRISPDVCTYEGSSPTAVPDSTASVWLLLFFHALLSSVQLLIQMFSIRCSMDSVGIIGLRRLQPWCSTKCLGWDVHLISSPTALLSTAFEKSEKLRMLTRSWITWFLKAFNLIS
jgi:hypothetical protein